MSQATSTTLTCADCEREFPRVNRGKPARCPECSAEHKRQMQAARMERYLDRVQPDRDADPVCRTCGKSFKRAKPTGQKPKYCPECKPDRLRQLGREIAARNYVRRVPGVPETFTCADCGGPFEFLRGFGRVPTRCRPCQATRTRSRLNEQRRAQRKSTLRISGGKRTTTCVTCKTELTCGPIGGLLRYCDPCRVEKIRERGRQRPYVPKPKPPRTIVCIDCNSSVTRSGRGAGAQKRCAKCAKKRARVIQKRMAAERRAWKYGAESERYEDAEIFERDGWRCGLCRKKINKRLKHPHLMAATVDHIFPFTKNGKNIRTNVHAAHRLCNQRKYNLGGGEQLMLIG